MESIKNIVEYYDELYPINSSIQNFYNDLSSKIPLPGHFLSIASNTGTLEFFLAKKGCDVTGIEVFQPLLDSSLLKRRTQLLSIRFFKLSTTEMINFLAKDFYNIVSCLNNRITYIHDQETMKQFFVNVKSMIKEGGKLVLHLLNLELLESQNSVTYPLRSSIRASLSTTVNKSSNGKLFLNQTLENSSGKLIPITQDEEIFPLTRKNLQDFAKAAGFSNFEFYSDFNKTPFDPEADELVCVIS